MDMSPYICIFLNIGLLIWPLIELIHNAAESVKLFSVQFSMREYHYVTLLALH